MYCVQMGFLLTSGDTGIFCLCLQNLVWREDCLDAQISQRPNSVKQQDSWICIQICVLNRFFLWRSPFTPLLRMLDLPRKEMYIVPALLNFTLWANKHMIICYHYQQWSRSWISWRSRYHGSEKSLLSNYRQSWSHLLTATTQGTGTILENHLQRGGEKILFVAVIIVAAVVMISANFCNKMSSLFIFNADWGQTRRSPSQ